METDHDHRVESFFEQRPTESELKRLRAFIESRCRSAQFRDARDPMSYLRETVSEWMDECRRRPALLEQPVLRSLCIIADRVMRAGALRMRG
jgi:hypothetical protein